MAAVSTSKAVDTDYRNYGSVDLNDGKGLPPDWQRDEQDFSLMAATIVGHVNGVADAYLSEDGAARHQFSWCGRADREGLALRRMQGYVHVTSDKWTKNPLLWEWEADEKDPGGPLYCVRFDDRLMARPAERYFSEKRRRESANPDKKANESLAQHPGAIAGRDQSGRQLIPTARQ